MEPSGSFSQSKETGLGPKDKNAEATLRIQTLMLAYNWKSFRHIQSARKAKTREKRRPSHCGAKMKYELPNNDMRR